MKGALTLIRTIREKVQEIKVLGSADYEVAHMLEDSLYEEVIRYFSSEKNDFTPDTVRQVCQEVLKTKAIRFRRHYA